MGFKVAVTLENVDPLERVIDVAKENSVVADWKTAQIGA
jgi:hypothetical protein